MIVGVLAGNSIVGGARRSRRRAEVGGEARK
jgi:hypothetical protein